MKAATRELADFVRAGINPVSLSKDSASYTFEGTVISAIETYKSAIGKNEAEQKRFEKQTEKRQKLVDAGKTPTWEVAPADYLDLDDLREQIVHQLTAMAEHLERQITRYGEKDYQALTVDMIDYFKAKAAASVDKLTKAAAKNYAIDLMGSVGIPDPRRRYRQYPFEFSGGMRQRIVIAIALTANPDILICDEPTTALDVTIQAQILELINRLKAERDLSIIFITHDLGVVANMADRIAVMYAGKIVEYGTAEDVFYSPAHPYTWALLSSVPDLDTNGRLESIPGTPPNMIYPPKGDAFAPRNKYAMKIDFEEQPPMFRISDTHYAATWLLHPNAPKLDPPAIITERIARMKQNGDKRKEGGADDEQ
ncbi:MAG: ATP-binding cassette domain-containing protein [Clostridia bacterium]|nr:ATP-binding cassette domain-containing protein [Clostridia bacterium]